MSLLHMRGETLRWWMSSHISGHSLVARKEWLLMWRGEWLKHQELLELLGRLHVFLDKHLKLTTKRKIYNACVLSVLLYGAECWVLLRKQEKKLNTFHHRLSRSILGITNRQQWSERISMTEVRSQGTEVSPLQLVAQTLPKM